ncbi:hypothetical protein ACJROX_22730 [Pseudalkalibacillus sp. A8]
MAERTDDKSTRDRKIMNANYMVYAVILGIPVLGLLIYLMYYLM